MVFLNDPHLFCILDLKFFHCPRKTNLIKCTPLYILQTHQACVTTLHLQVQRELQEHQFPGVKEEGGSKESVGCLFASRQDSSTE